MFQERKKFSIYLLIFIGVFFTIFGTAWLIFGDKSSNNLQSGNPSIVKPSNLKSDKTLSATGSGGGSIDEIEKKEFDPLTDNEDVSVSVVDRIYIPINRDQKAFFYSVLSNGKDFISHFADLPSKINHVQVLQYENQAILSLSKEKRAFRFNLTDNKMDPKPVIDTDTIQLELSPDRKSIFFINSDNNFKTADTVYFKITQAKAKFSDKALLSRYAPNGELVSVYLSLMKRDMHPDYEFSPNCRDDYYSIEINSRDRYELKDKPEDIFISPDGSKALVKIYDRTEGHQLLILDFATKDIQVIYHQNIICHGWSSDNSTVFFSKTDSTDKKLILYKMILKTDGKHKVYRIKDDKGEIIKL